MRLKWLTIISIFLFFDLLPASKITQIIIRVKSGIELWQIHGGVPRSNNTSLTTILSVSKVSTARSVFSAKIKDQAPSLKDYYVLDIDKNADVTKSAETLQTSNAIIWAEPNYRFPLHFIPNDSLYSQQWALRRIGMEKAWDIQKGDSQIVVGVIDTGVDYLHPDLQTRIWVNKLEDVNRNGKMDAVDQNGVDDDGNGYIDDVVGWDFTDAPNFPDGGDYLVPDNDPMDEFPGGHGTAVSGIISAGLNNTIGTAGMAPGVKLMPLRAGTASGYLEEDDVAEAIVYAIHNGCRIVNMSFGDVVYSHLIKDAVSYGRSRGVLFVASAGNSGNSVLQYPAAYDETIAVGATDSDNNLAPFSSFGSKIDLVAPGQSIFSLSTGGDYGQYSGTSFSAPHVCAALALIWSENPGQSVGSVKSRLISGLRDLGANGWDIFFGNGLLDVFAGLTGVNKHLAQIDSPVSNSGFFDGPVAVVGSAMSPELKHYTLEFGTGSNPFDWTLIQESSNQVIEDTLGIWQIDNLPDTLYTIQLTVTTLTGQTFSRRNLVYIDRTPANADSIAINSVISRDNYAHLIEVFTDDQTTIVLKYRRPGELQFGGSQASTYFANQHAFILSQPELDGTVEFYFELKNTSGLSSIINNQGAYYRVSLNQPYLNNKPIQLTETYSGAGYLLNKAPDLNNDGLSDVVGYIKWPDKTKTVLSFINFNNGNLQRYLSGTRAFPRDFADLNEDGHPDLLAGFGGTSILFNGAQLPTLQQPPVSSTLTDFWIARALPTGGPHAHQLIALHQNQWQIFALQDFSNFSVTNIQQLENTTAGENSYGVPYVEIADLDGDSRSEIIFGDYDGDLLLYEQNGSGNFNSIFNLPLPGVDATYRFVVGDFDADSMPELAVATQHLAEYIGESAVNREYWLLTILKSFADNSLEIIWQQKFLGVSRERSVYSGVAAADYDADGVDEILFMPYPSAYLIEWEADSFHVDWYRNGINSNAAPLVDAAKFILTGDSTLMVFEATSPVPGPPPPDKSGIVLASKDSIRLRWKPVPGAEYYRVDRKHLGSQTTISLPATTSLLTDTTVDGGEIYSYQIRTVDSAYGNPLGQPGRSHTAAAVDAPQFINLTPASHNQLLLAFSDNLGELSFNTSHFFLVPDSIFPLSVLRAQGSRKILLTFQERLFPGAKNLLVSGLSDRFNVPFLGDTLNLEFQFPNAMDAPYVHQVKLAGRNRIYVYFSQKLDLASSQNTENYHLIPEEDILSAKLLAGDSTVVVLQVGGKTHLGSPGIQYRLTISGVKNKAGILMQPDIGEQLVLSHMPGDLNELVVFPNPLRHETNKNEITFGNVPEGSEIFIYTASGRRVIQLMEVNNKWTVNWDLRNQQGKRVGSGVYIFLARYKSEKKMGKFVILK